MKLFDAKTNEVVTLPTTLDDFRGDPVRVVRIQEEPSLGKSGKVLIEIAQHHSRTLYPQTVGCYIADEPRSPLDSAA